MFVFITVVPKNKPALNNCERVDFKRMITDRTLCKAAVENSFRFMTYLFNQ